MNNCPCCSHTLLKHIRRNKIYWFCRNCWQSMPVFSEEKRFTPKVLTLGDANLRELILHQR